MDLRDRIFGSKVGAICDTVLQENNLFTINVIGANNAQINQGDEVRIRIFKTDDSVAFNNRKSKAFTTTVLPDSMKPEGVGDGPLVMVNNNIVTSLELEEGDPFFYLAVPTDKLPSPSSGPVRKATQDSKAAVQDRPRQTEEFAFDARMAVSGQITIKSPARDALNVGQYDEVEVEVQGPEGSITDILEIGSGNRISLSSDQQDAVGIPKDEKGDVSVVVRIP